MQVYGPAQLHGAQAINSPHHARLEPASPAATSQVMGDEVQISEAGRLLDLAHQLPEIRQERVEALRDAIARGRYETAEKLDLAVERLLDEIA